MQAGAIGAGSFIESRCLRCRDVTGHVVIVMVGGAVGKVECKACGSVHLHRPPREQGVKRDSRSATVMRVRAGSDRSEAAAVQSAELTKTNRAAAQSRRYAPTLTGSATPRAGANQKRLDAMWQDAVIGVNPAFATNYSLETVFSPNEFVLHPSFGLGKVLIVSQGRMDVLFQSGIKKLLHKAD